MHNERDPRASSRALLRASRPPVVCAMARTSNAALEIRRELAFASIGSNVDASVNSGAEVCGV